MSNEENYAEREAKARYESICSMVAALECNYDRLEELRDEYNALDPEEVHDWPYACELAELEEAAGDCADAGEARQRIEEDALSVEVRSDWQSPGARLEATEFQILLCTGGPAVRIVGQLNEHREPSRAWIEYQDWGTPWTQYCGKWIEGTKPGEFGRNEVSQETLLAYCRCFYFGEA
jgi:hypothetical protein